VLDNRLPDDPFDTASLRRRVLDAWAASPARFREDANAEEDYALGGYRDRVVVELAQNAADAAARAGVPGRLRLTLRDDGTLTADNTGAPLDAAGVEGISTLRASGKRDDDSARTVGRFGVGFAAVVAVCDEPRMVSRTGAVRWSRAQSRALAAGLPALADELAVRGGNVPVLRLPFPADSARPENALAEGFDTTVFLPLRDADAVALAGRLLAQAGPELLLALPALAEVTVRAGDSRRTLAAVRDGDSVTITQTVTPRPNAPADSPAGQHTVTRWRTRAADGPLEAALLADRPVEERARPAWSLRWAVPVAEGTAVTGSTAVTGTAVPTRLPDGVSPVVHAPTPSDEPLGLPALLIASFPLSPDRRHVAPGPLTEYLVERAADAYAALLPELAPGHGLLDLVPGPVAAGELDGQLRRAILDRLAGVAFLPAADETGRVTPRDALLLDIAAPPGLGGYLADLLPGLIGGPSRHPAYSVLGIRRMPLADLADMLYSPGGATPLSATSSPGEQAPTARPWDLPAAERPAAWWRGLYAALAGVDSTALPELGALPVPLADGRLIRGPRGVLLPGPGLTDPARLVPLRLRIADPDAVHPLLVRLGALEATPRGALEHPATLAAVDASLDEEDPAPIADAVLSLVQAAGARPGEYPWLADLALPTDDDQWDPAGDLLLPGGELAGVVAADADFGVVASELADRYGPQVLEAAGVLGSFGLLTEQDVEFGDIDPMEFDPDDHPSSAADLDLDGAPDWADSVRARCAADDDGPVPPIAVEVIAVRDLDLVDPARWPRALEILTTRPRLRAALVKPTRVRQPDGGVTDVPSYTSWWLRTHPVLAGRRPADLRTSDADPLLEGLYDDAADLPGDDPRVARLLADPVVTAALGVRTSLSGLLAEPGGPDDLLDRLADPERPVTRQQLRSLWMALGAAALGPGASPPARIRAVHDGEVVVADADDVLVLDSPDLYPLVSGRPLVLAPYDLALVLSELLDVAVASEQAPGRVESTPERREVPGLVHAVLPDAPDSYLAHDKLLVDGAPVPWRCVDGEVHAATSAGLACGLAWAAGQWHARHLLTTLLSSRDESARLLAEADLDPL
jgi:hypothetical protein